MRFLFLVYCSLLLSIAPGYSQTYRWVDDNGIVNYSQTPPTSQDAETMTIRSPSKEDSAEADRRLNELRQHLEDQREDRQLAKEAAEKAKQEENIQQKNCAAARSNLTRIKGLGTRLLKTTDGEYVRLTEDQRQNRIQTAKTQIELYCSP